MNYFVCGNIAGNKYRVEARRSGYDSELMGIYDGYYNSRYHTFSLYRKILGGSAQPWDVPEKVTISAYEVKKVQPKSVKKEKEPECAVVRRRLPRDVEGQLKIG